MIFNKMMVLSWAMEREIVNYMQREFKAKGIDDLHPMHAYTLGIIYSHPGVTMGELVVHTTRTKSDISLIVKKLIAQGYLLKVQSEVDKRNYRMELTEKALVVKDIVFGIMGDLTKQMMREIGEDDRKIAEQAMGKYVEILKKL